MYLSAAGRGQGPLGPRGFWPAWLTIALLVVSVPRVVKGEAAAAQVQPAEALSAPASLDTTAVLNAPADEMTHRVRIHYLWSNERRHDLFFKPLRDLGGGYLGVGGDQNYTLAAAASASVLWLVDLDASVVYMHRLYAALLGSAPTAKDFLARFEKRAAPAVHAAVAARYEDPVEQQAILEIYHAYRDLLRNHLRRMARAPRGRTWLADRAKYQHIRDLALAGRLVARRGDLTGPAAMLEIADAAKRAGVPMRVVYLSNAESWFRYNAEFRHNMGAMPFDEKSVILRTVKSQLLSYPSGDIWHYVVQRGQHFTESLSRSAYRSVDFAMIEAASGPGKGRSKRGLSFIGFSAEPGAKPLFAVGAGAKGRRDARALLSAGLVTRPAGNRESAREMDRERRRRAALELSHIH